MTNRISKKKKKLKTNMNKKLRKNNRGNRNQTKIKNLNKYNLKKIKKSLVHSQYRHCFNRLSNWLDCSLTSLLNLFLEIKVQKWRIFSQINSQPSLSLIKISLNQFLVKVIKLTIIISFLNKTQQYSTKNKQMDRIRIMNRIKKEI